MEFRFRGLLTRQQFFQSVYELDAFFEEHNISHVVWANLYLTPGNQDGEKTTHYIEETGEEVKGCTKRSAYNSAADKYVPFEPEPILQPAQDTPDLIASF